MAAGDGAGARGHRLARLGDHPPPEGLGGLRPPLRLLRPARRLPHLQAPLPRRPHGDVAVRQAAVEAAGRDRRLRPDRGAAVQPHVRDVDRPRARRGLGRLPAARDRAGHLRQLQERHLVDAREAAVRHRADRQELPQRDHARELPLPHARVRADGDGVLRAARRGRGVLSLLDRRAPPLVPRPRPAREPPARAPARRRRALALLERHERPRVPVPDRLVGARGDREPRRLSTYASTPSTRGRSSSGSARRSATSRT